MRDLFIVQGDSRQLRFRCGSGAQAIYLGSGDYGLFTVRDYSGTVLLRKRFDSENQSGDGFVSIALLPEETASLRQDDGGELLPGDLVPLKWGIKLFVGDEVVSPAVAEPLYLIADVEPEDTV